jgi:hypothetical protein
MPSLTDIVVCACRPMNLLGLIDIVVDPTERSKGLTLLLRCNQLLEITDR